MGKGGGSQPTTSTAYQTNLPEYAKPYVMNMLGAAQNQLFTTTPGTDGQPGEITGFKPYTPYSTDPTKYFAGPTGLQTGVYNEASRMQTPGAYGAAQGMAGAAGLGQFGTAQQGEMLGRQGMGIGQMGLAGAMPAFQAGQQYASQVTNPNAVSQYMSPYMQNVVDTQKAAAVREAQMANQASNLASARSGTYGGARQALAQAERERGLLANLSNIQAQGSQNAYNQALQNMQYGANLGLQGISTGLQGIQAGQQGVSQGLAGLGAQQAGYAGAGAQATNLANIAGTQQQSDLARLGFQQQTGQAQQQYQQNIINQAIQDYATAQQYPLMQLSAMSSLLRGLPLQSATTQQYQAAPSLTSQIAGLGTAGIGAYGLGRATGVFKKGGQVKGYKYGGAISDEKLKAMANSLTVDQLQAQLRDPSLTTDERQIFASALQDKSSRSGLTALSTNLDTLAGGGIVAFANEGYVEEEDDDSTDVSYPNEEDDNDLVDAILAGGIPAGAYDGRGLGSVGLNQAAPTGTGIRADAKAPRGLDAENFISKIMARESGGRHYDKSGNILTSSKGAQGSMQVMPGTQMDPGFGVKPAKDKSPQELERVGKDYATVLLNRYDDPKIAAIAYNWGPGNTDKWLKAGADFDKLPAETKKYIRGIKEGGAIRFQNTGLVSDGLGYVSFGEEAPYDYTGPSGLENLKDWWKRNTFGTKEYFREQQPKPTSPEGGAVPYIPGTDDTYDPDLNTASRGISMVDEKAVQKEFNERAAQEKELAAEKEKATAGISKLEDILLKREQANEKQGKIDASLAAILGGLTAASARGKTTGEALTEGAKTGIGTYMTSAKQRMADANSILSGRLGIEKMRGLQDIRQSQMAQNRQGVLERNLGAYERKARDSALQILKANNLLALDATPEQQAQMANELAVKNLANDPTYRKMYKDLFGFEFAMPTSTATTRSPDEIKKQFKVS